MWKWFGCYLCQFRFALGLQVVIAYLMKMQQGLAPQQALVLPAPDLLITGDGRHVAVRDDRGGWAILRPRAGGFVRQALAERAGYAADLADLDSADRAHCSPDACVITLDRAGRSWTLLAIRSRDHLRWADLVSACQRADILVSARRLPGACAARWLTLDPQFLAKTGGLAVHLSPAGVEMVHPRRDDHPWAIAPSSP
jgi:competence protein ComEC